MNIFNNQKGSTHMIAIFGVLVIALAGFAGYRVMQAAEPSGTSDTAVTTGEPEKIKNKADLVKAEDSLDEAPIDSSVNPSDLDQDINSLL